MEERGKGITPAVASPLSISVHEALTLWPSHLLSGSASQYCTLGTKFSQLVMMGHTVLRPVQVNQSDSICFFVLRLRIPVYKTEH